MVEINESQNLTPEQVRARFSRVFQLSKVGVYRIPSKTDESILSLEYHRTANSGEMTVQTDQNSLALLAHPHEFVEPAKYILRKLDPTPEEQTLESLERIERLLESRASD